MIAKPIRERDPTETDGFASWFRAWRLGAIIAVLIALSYPDVLFGWRTFVFRDYGFFSYPLAFWFREQFWQGVVPLWNPSSNCGIPFLAQWNTLACYPFSLIYLCLPLPWSLGFFTLLHWFLGAMGMYCLASAQVNHRFAAGIAAVAYAFNGLTINSLMWPHMTAALGWMPWVVLAVARVWRKGGRSVVSAAVLSALQMLTGAVELILLTWLLVFLMYVAECRRQPGSLVVSARNVGGVVVLVTGLCALQLLPFLDLLRHSNRDTAHFSNDSALPLYGWANFLVPLFRTARSPVGIYYQPGQFWTTSYYASLLVLALAVYAVWRSHSSRLRWLAVAALVSVLIAFGDHFFIYSWLRKLLPVVNLINFPVKYLLVIPLLVSLMAAYGIRECQREGELRTNRSGFIGIFVTLIVLVIGVIAYAGISPKPYESWSVVCRNGLMRIGFLIGGFILLRWSGRDAGRDPRWQSAASLGVLLLIWSDVSTHAPRQNPTVENLAFQPGLQRLAGASTSTPDRISRLMLSNEARQRSDRVTLPDPLQDYLGHRLSQTMNCNLLDGFAKVDGFYPLYLKEQTDILGALYSQTNSLASPLADFLSVSHVSTPGNPLEFSPRGSFAPVVTAGQLPVFADTPATLRGLWSGDFIPGRHVYLPLEAKGVVAVTNSSAATTVARWLGSDRAEIEVNATQPSLLVVAQSYYHPWHATVNGRSARIWRANHAFQAIEVPGARSVVTLVYEDRAFSLGLIVSVLTLATLPVVARNKQRLKSHEGNR